MTTTRTTAAPMPEPAVVGRRAAEIFGLVQADQEYLRLESSSLRYADCWKTFTGYSIVSRFDLATDAPALLGEALRVLALKAAVYELTGGDEAAAELLVPGPVDEMVHAVLAQHTLVVRLTHRLGISFVHMTDREEFGWRPGDYTEQCYRAAGFGDPDPRYWIGAEETVRRLGILTPKYHSIGFVEVGRRSVIDFDDAKGEPALVLAG
jgi:hypothetical protein